jgi:cytochrome c2
VFDQQTAAPHAGADGLWRWLVGGLIGGALILGLLIAAYAIGYHNGRHHRLTAAPAPTATTTTSAPTTTTATPAAGPVQTSPALVARGKALYSADGCSACHSLSGGTGVGPHLNGVAGTQVTLTDGTTVTADDAYLERSITDPDAQIVKGFRAGIMPAAVASFGLNTKPDDVRALVAYLKTQH